MPLPGGPSDKWGNLYELYWTVHCFTQVMQGEFESIRLEPPGEDGIEFWLDRGNTRQYHQVKAQHGIAGKWTIADLDTRGVLRTFWAIFQQPGAECYFVSMHAVGDLDELSKRARASQNWNEYKQLFLATSQALGTKFKELCSRLGVEAHPERAYEFLKCVWFKNIDADSLREQVERSLGHLVDKPTNTVLQTLVTFALESVHKQLGSIQLWDYLHDKGFDRKTVETLTVSISANDLRAYLDNLVSNIEAQEGINEHIDLKFTAALPKTSVFSQDVEHIVGKVQPTSSKTIPVKESIEAVVHKFGSCVITGEPGAGKTTLLRRLALEAARKCLANLGDFEYAPIPFYVDLTQWKNEKSPEEFISSHWYFERQVDVLDLLARGHAILYMDGLNEMGGQGPAKAKLLKNWLHGQSESPIMVVRRPKLVIITCRQIDYADLFDLDLPSIRLEGLDNAQIQEFVHNYLGNKAKDFLAQIAKKSGMLSGLEDLASNPYLLRALLIVYQTSDNQSLPLNTGTLFQDLVNRLWQRETEIQGNFDSSIVEKHLSVLAFSMIDSERPTSVSLDYVRLYVEDLEMLEVANRAGIVELNSSQVRFKHQLMQEYFAAKALLQVGLSNIDFDAGGKQSIFSVLFSTRITTNWHEVIVAMCGIASNPLNLVSEIAIRNPQLARDCVSSGIAVNEDSILPSIILALRSDQSEARVDAASILGQFRDDRVIPHLLKSLYDNESVRTAAAKSLLSVGDLAPNLLIEAIERSITREKWEVFNALLSVLIGMGKSIRPLIIDLLSHSHPQMKVIAISVLGEIRDEDSLDSLLALASNENDAVRKATATALGNIGGSLATEVLISMLDDKSSEIRKRVAEILGSLRVKEAVDKLIERLLDDTLQVHLAAFKALREIKARKGLIATTPFNRLKARYWSKRQTAFQRLYALYGARGLFYALSHRYSNAQIYWEIADAIAKYASDDEMNDLADRMHSGKTVEEGRIAYIIGLKKDIRHAEALLPLVSGTSSYVRGQAIRALGELRYAPAVSTLAEKLTDEATVYTNNKVRVCDYTRTALEAIGTSEAFEALAKAPVS